MYWKYFKYVLEHKKNVYKECMHQIKQTHDKKDKTDLFIHALIHDLSKFSPKEFKAYAWKFYGGKQASRNLLKAIGLENKCISQEDIDEGFDKAWEHHYKNNKHHPEYWDCKDIPNKYLIQMICDWKAMSRKFGGTVQEYYLKNYYKWDFDHDTRLRLEIYLDLIKEYNAPLCECNREVYMTVEELYKEEYDLNDLLKPACVKYDLDIKKLMEISTKGE